MVRISLNADEVTDEILEKVEGFVTRLAVDLSNLLKEEVPVDSGQLRQSVHVISSGPSGATVGIRAPHAVPIALGTQPYWPPVDPLKDWARRNLGAESAAYAVQHKIADEGIDANPYHERAMERLEAKYGG